MQVKKEVFEKVKGLLEKEYATVQYKIRMNKRAMAQLTHEQTVLKRERVKLHELMRTLQK